MLIPRSHTWTPLQKWLIVTSTFAAVALLGVLIYRYERYGRGPTDTVLVGTWSGEFVDSLANFEPGYRFKADHTFEELASFGNLELEVSQTGRWYAGGDFLYLRIPIEMDDGWHSRLEAWHIDAVTRTELRIRFERSTLALRRVE